MIGNRQGARRPLYAASGGHAGRLNGETAAEQHMTGIAFLLNGTPVRLTGEPRRGRFSTGCAKRAG
jgi:hypothetical protein